MFRSHGAYSLLQCNDKLKALTQQILKTKIFIIMHCKTVVLK